MNVTLMQPPQRRTPPHVSACGAGGCEIPIYLEHSV